jgi:hypothetical protein
MTREMVVPFIRFASVMRTERGEERELPAIAD